MDRVLDQSMICLPFFSLFIVLQHWDGNEMGPEWPLDHFVEAWNFLNLSSKGLFGKTNFEMTYVGPSQVILFGHF